VKGIRVLVVDDEKPARARLVELLGKSSHVTDIREGQNGRDAVHLIGHGNPDLVFLDVQMPELDGFEVLRKVGLARMPVVVFVTAFDQFALRAFENNALDYLLKPFSDERFELCLERAIAQVRMRERNDVSQRLAQLLNAWKPGGEPLFDRLAIRGGGRVLFLNVDEIVWIQAAGVYVDLHTAHKAYLHRATLADLEARLDPTRFVRIHRSIMVNILHIRELLSQAHGDGTVILNDRTELRLSRSYRSRLEQCLGQPL
jgi:two-component system LytT family response regulator